MLEVFLFESIRSVWVLAIFLNDDEEKFERMAAAEGDESRCDKEDDLPTPSHLNPGRILNRLGAEGPLYLGRLGPFFFLLCTSQLLSICS
jgi:hypothetical protein